jgi:hypothetical protein
MIPVERERLADVLHCLQLSVLRRGERKCLARRRSMARPDKHISPRYVQFHRHARDLRAHRRQEKMHPDRAFAAERAADERTDHAHVLQFQT